MTSRTADYAELVRSLVRDDWTAYDQRSQQLTEESGWDGWSEFLGAGFVVAVERRFNQATDPAEVIRFVAEARAEFKASGSDFTPEAAEKMINSVLDRASAEGVDTQTVVQVEIVVIRKVLRDANLSDAELDAFLTETAQLSAEWTTEA
jgi:hypothetical protein